MRVHVRYVSYKGEQCFMLYYPGWDEKEAQWLADQINGEAYNENKALRQQRDDLLEALERVQRKFYPANQREQNRDFTWHIVNKAIAKAKGEQQ